MSNHRECTGRYRFGCIKTAPFHRLLLVQLILTPVSLLPGLRAKAAFSYEKSKEDVLIESENGEVWRPSYMIFFSRSLMQLYLELRG
ncbi:hypothetical protein CASFOL_041155 [Castilleja foliolosa]|uniref:Uncharacterized protein n=1 Tax=Castilleja foliolosa TaxID=1961234 RepID=A0ABD3BE09_9LAMI